jgi:serine/threonine-protein kinase
VIEAHADIKRRAGGRVGSVLRNKYRLDRLLGIGGMASVFAATHVNNKSRVAIKMLHAELSVNADIRARFLREGYVANSVEHKGVVRVIDDDITEDGAVFLVMELLDGETVGARCKRLGGKLPPEEVAAIARPLLDVLTTAHDKQIVHRDVKPDNVFVTCDGVVKVLDFGIARLREGTNFTSTQSGQTVGTPAFMAPEQALGRAEEIGPFTDVWAVGATMFTLLTGALPHPARSDNEMLVLAATKPMRAVSSLNDTIPAELARIVDKATAFESGDRYADARAMRADLDAAMRAMSWKDHEVVAPPMSSALPADGYAPTKADVDARARASDPPPGVRSGVEATDPLAPTLASNDTGRATSPTSTTTTAGVASQRRASVQPVTVKRSRRPMILIASSIAIGAAVVVGVVMSRGTNDTSKPTTPIASTGSIAATPTPSPTSPPQPIGAAVESTTIAAPTASAPPSATTTIAITAPTTKITTKPKITITVGTAPVPSASTPKVNPYDHQ